MAITTTDPVEHRLDTKLGAPYFEMPSPGHVMQLTRHALIFFATSLLVAGCDQSGSGSPPLVSEARPTVPDARAEQEARELIESHAFDPRLDRIDQRFVEKCETFEEWISKGNRAPTNLAELNAVDVSNRSVAFSGLDIRTRRSIFAEQVEYYVESEELKGRQRSVALSAIRTLRDPSIHYDIGDDISHLYDHDEYVSVFGAYLMAKMFLRLGTTGYVREEELSSSSFTTPTALTSSAELPSIPTSYISTSSAEYMSSGRCDCNHYYLLDPIGAGSMSCGAIDQIHCVDKGSSSCASQFTCGITGIGRCEGRCIIIGLDLSNSFSGGGGSGTPPPPLPGGGIRTYPLGTGGSHDECIDVYYDGSYVKTCCSKTMLAIQRCAGIP